MKEGWTYKKLGEVCEILGRIGFRGYTREDYVDTIEEGAISLSPSNIINNHLDFTNCTYITWDKYNQSPEIKISEGDVIFVKTASVGKCAYVSQLPHESTINPQFVVFKNITIYNRFLFYELLSAAFQYNVKRITSGTSVPTITQKGLSELDISYPCYKQQECIVSELDLISSIIEKKNAQLKELDNLAQSIFYDMFGDPVTNEKRWEVKKLGEVAQGKLSYGSGASAIQYNGEIRYVRITDIKENGELNSDIVSPSAYDEKYLLYDGDILFARSGATVGKTFHYKEKYGKCVYAGYLIRLVPNTDMVIPSFLYGYTQSQYYRDFIAKAQNAVAQPNINAKQYSDLPIPLPPLSLQQSFAEKIEAIEKQKELIQQSIKETETLFNSRMDYYFN